ncbi:LytR/AlgR family response regulator transcription factor [Algoriphagus sp. Y33]|uniref:LytR/AlgR family response regulator transcription factor n=1 Tax=Algoriphagus sp. Y33 TaxID=2772483 RepID=UPI00351C8CE2
MINCLIVDDEPVALNLLESYVRKTGFLNLKKACKNAFEVIDFLHSDPKVDILFLDIQMPELTGIDLSKTLPENIWIVFTTAFEQYALEGYKVNAVDYLLKPFNYSEFLNAVTKARDLIYKMEKTAEEESKPLVSKELSLFVKSDYKHVRVFLNEILYFEGMKDYVKIYLTDKVLPIITLISLKRLEEELPANMFMRVHRSFIVNLQMIQEVERHQIIFGSQRITIAPQYREKFDQFLEGNSF